VFADRYERRSILVTSNLPFDEWATVFQGEQVTFSLRYNNRLPPHFTRAAQHAGVRLTHS